MEKGIDRKDIRGVISTLYSSCGLHSRLSEPSISDFADSCRRTLRSRGYDAKHVGPFVDYFVCRYLEIKEKRDSSEGLRRIPAYFCY